MRLRVESLVWVLIGELRKENENKKRHLSLLVSF